MLRIIYIDTYSFPSLVLGRKPAQSITSLSNGSEVTEIGMTGCSGDDLIKFIGNLTDRTRIYITSDVFLDTRIEKVFHHLHISLINNQMTNLSIPGETDQSFTS